MRQQPTASEFDLSDSSEPPSEHHDHEHRCEVGDIEDDLDAGYDSDLARQDDSRETYLESIADYEAGTRWSST